MSDANMHGLFRWSTETADPDKKGPARALRDSWSGVPFPTEALPDLVYEAIEEVARITQAPGALVACSALSTASAVVQDVASVQRNAQLIGPAGLYFLVVAKSGERKTTVDRFFSAPIREWENDQRELAKPIRAEFIAAMENWESIKAGLRDAQRKAAKDGEPSSELAEQLRKHELARPVEPKLPSLLRGDDTPEAFAAALERWPVAFALSSEGGLVFGGPGMSQDTVMRNLSQFNLAWDGARIQRARTTGQNVDIEGMRVTVFWQVQPEVLNAFLDKSGALAKDMGFLARFLVCRPPSTQGSRAYEPPGAATPALERFNSRVREVLGWRRALDEQDRIVTYPVAFDSLAEAIWVDFYDRVEERLAEHGRYYHVQEFASKAAEQAARLACVLEVFCATRADASATQDGEFRIGQQAMNSAVKVIDWFLEEAIRLHEQTLVPRSLVLAEQLEQWIASQMIRGRRHFVTLTEIAQRGPNGTREAKARDAALQLLDDHNRLLKFSEAGKRAVSLAPEVFEEWREIFAL
jgi:hypothetical protein